MYDPQQLQIIADLERTDALWPQVDGLVEYANIPGVRANYSDDPFYMANRVSAARLTTGTAVPAIKEVISFFASRNLEFAWSVGPLSTPANLGELLEEHGFHVAARADGLFLEHLERTDFVPHGFTITELPIAEYRTVVPTMAEGFDMPIESSERSHRILHAVSDRVRVRLYTVRPDRDRAPVACAYTTYFPDSTTALLSGAAVLPDYRGRSLYRALLHRRINDAIDDSLTTLLVVANRETSAPICRRFGFTRICETTYYRYGRS